LQVSSLTFGPAAAQTWSRSPCSPITNRLPLAIGGRCRRRRQERCHDACSRSRHQRVRSLFTLHMPGKPIALSPGGGTEMVDLNPENIPDRGRHASVRGRLGCRDGDRAATKQLAKGTYAPPAAPPRFASLTFSRSLLVRNRPTRP
jgi:hypothetical protein